MEDRALSAEYSLYHHYLPSFYQSRWADEKGKLRRFSKPHGSKLVAKWVSPKVSGGENLLYTDHSAPPQFAQMMESGFLKPLDTLADEALKRLDDPLIQRDSRLRSAWSRFLMSLMMRMPDHLETLEAGLVEGWAKTMPELEAAYAEKRGAKDPATFSEYLETRSPEEFRSWMLSVLKRLIDHEMIGERLNNMRWFTRHIPGNAEFLTSDRPIVTLYELAAPDSYIILPIGPKSAFVAVNNEETQRRIEANDAEEWVKGLNRIVVGAAKKFVFARNDSMKDFIAEHFGKQPRTTIFEHLVQFRRRKNEEARPPSQSG